MTMRNSLIHIAGAALLWAGAVPALTAQELPLTRAVGEAQSTPELHYRLRSGDVLELNFPFVPDFNQTITVQPDGFVTLRALGTLRVQSMTVPELTEKLRTEYDTILQDPVVTVELPRHA